jgi:hypothetical protein
MAEEGYPCWILTWQPCDYLLEQILNAFACCLGLCDSFCHPREPYQDQAADDGTDQTTTVCVLSPSSSLQASVTQC